MTINFKKLTEEAVLPSYANDGDAGLDLTAVSKKFDEYGNVVYGTGLAIEIPDSFEAIIRPRSSISKYALTLCNSVATIDSGYRGELILKFKPTGFFDSRNQTHAELYEVGDKIGQLLIKPVIYVNAKLVTNLTESERGEKGFGSSGL